MAKRLPKKVFLDSFRHVPRVAVNLVISNKKGEFLLAKRAIPPRIGVWHIAGSFLTKGEELNACLQRVAEEELGINIFAKNVKLLGVFEDIDKDPRGHVVDLVYGYEVGENVRYKPGKDTQEIKYFTKIPEKIGFTHGKVLRQLGYK